MIKHSSQVTTQFLRFRNSGDGYTNNIESKQKNNFDLNRLQNVYE